MSARRIATVVGTALCLLIGSPYVTGASAAAQACLTERAPAGSRVLVFSRTAAFRHQSIPTGVEALRRLGDSYGFVVEATEDAAIFTDEALRRFSAVVFLSTTGDALDPAQEAAFQRYIRGGGGYVGIHAASDTEHEWSWYGELVGAYFRRHPQIQPASVVVSDRTHISTRCLPAVWTRTDEWYDFTAQPAPGMKILASLDEGSYQGGQMGQAHPIVWYHEFDGGRAWYTGLGHTNESFVEPAFLEHLAGGIIWAMKKPVPQAAAPTPAPRPAPATPAGRPATAAVDFSPRDPVRPLSPEEELRSIVLQPGYRMEAVLTEPVISEPTQIAFDGNGRMFVLEMRSYMQDADGTNELTPVSVISLHDDTDNDGVYDKHTTYVDSLVVPRFVMPFGPNSILTAESNQDDIWIYTDRDDDGVADDRQLFATNFGRTANIEHQPANMTWAMDNWLYTTYNNFRLRWSPAGALREATGNPGGAWGVTQDNYGKTYIQEGHTGLPAYTQFPIRYGDFQWQQRFQEGLEVPYPLVGLADYQPGAQASHPDGLLNRVTGSAGNDVIRGHRMPADMQGNYIYGEPVARIVRRLRMVDMGGLDQFQNVYQPQQDEFIRSKDPLFRPVQQETAPDGTLYIVDLYRGIIQEGNWTQPESYLRQKIDQYRMGEVIGNGRIWRVSHESLPRDTIRPRMNDETPAQLVRHLEHPNGWWRDTAQRLIILAQDRTVISALEAMARSSSNELARYHALWTLEGLSALTPALVRSLMLDPSPEVRIQAIRASETLFKAGDLSFEADYRRMTGDVDADVVIQALLTLNYFQRPDAGGIALLAMDARTEPGVEFVAERIISRLETPPPLGLAGVTAVERALIERGRSIYPILCVTCRELTGIAVPTPAMPDGWLMAAALAGNPLVTGHRDYVIKALLHGVQGPGLKLPAFGANDDELIAGVASYLRNSFTNNAPPIRPEDVAAVRAASAGRSAPWTPNELAESLPVQLDPLSGWIVTASHEDFPIVVGSTGAPSGAFNFEGWTTGVPQEQGMWFQIEMPQAVNLAEIEFLSPASGRPGQPQQRHAPLEYTVEVSMDGRSWSQVARGVPAGTAATTISFEPVRGRFLRITQSATPAAGAPRWTMHRMKIYAE